MISTPYQGLQEFPVKDKTNLFQTGLAELANARNIMSTARRLLGVSDSNTTVALVGEDSKIIKLMFSDRGRQLMYMYYMPGSHRLDIYDETGMCCAFDHKKCIYTSCSEGLKRLGFEGLFKQLVTLT